MLFLCREGHMTENTLPSIGIAAEIFNEVMLACLVDEVHLCLFVD